MGLTASFPLGGILLEPVRFLLALTIILSFLYFFGVILAMFALYYYQIKLVWIT